MPKPSTSPFIFDEVKTICISDLKLLTQRNENLKSGVLTWKRSGSITGRIRISVITDSYTNALFLDYVCNDKEYSYKIDFTVLPSNLGIGNIMYFICPITGRRCRKLHFISERFMHRSALPNGMYSKQTQSKDWRKKEKIFGSYFEVDEVCSELYKKYFKTHYNGKPTKRFLKLKSKLEQFEKITHTDLERLLING